MNIIVTGSNGLIGKGLCEYLQTKGYLFKGVDLIDGVDLSNEKSNDKFFQSNSKYDRLINLFAINDHVEKKEKTLCTYFLLLLFHNQIDHPKKVF